MNFQKGDMLVFERGKRDIVGWAISKFTKSQFVHVGIVLDDKYFIESQKRGVVITSIQKAVNERNQDIWHCQLKPEHRLKVEQNKDLFNKIIREELHKRYDFLQILKFGLNIISGGRYKPSECNKYNVCSELAAYLLKSVGILDESLNTSLVSPVDVFEFTIYSGRRLLQEKS